MVLSKKRSLFLFDTSEWFRVLLFLFVFLFVFILDVEKHTRPCTVVFGLNDKVDSDKIILLKFGH